MKDANETASDQSTEQLGLYKQEKITDPRGAQGNDGPTGNQNPELKPGKLAKGFTIK